MEARLMEILPPLTPGQSFGHAADPDPDTDTLDLTQPLPEELAFTPVPRHGTQKRKIDADVQRAFIAALAASGSVRHAARTVGFTATSLYPLRHHAEGGSFARAWDRAVSYGARQVLDTLMDHAINGAPETLLLPDGSTLERRRYNSRTMQWIVAHHFPESYATADGLSDHGGLSENLKKLKAKWRKEWEEEQAAKAARPETKDERYWRERREDEVIIEAMTRVMLRRIADLQGKPAKPYKTIEGLTEAEIAALDDDAEQRLNSSKDNAEDSAPLA
jgi:hypothetical protein